MPQVNNSHPNNACTLLFSTPSHIHSFIHSFQTCVITTTQLNDVITLLSFVIVPSTEKTKTKKNKKKKLDLEIKCK
jgi:hypothetical protein